MCLWFLVSNWRIHSASFRSSILVFWEIFPCRFWHFVNSFGPQYATQHSILWNLSPNSIGMVGCYFFSWFSNSNMLEVFERQRWGGKLEHKLFTTTHPLCLFVEILTCLASTTGIEFDVSQIPGADSVIADDLSRWDFSTPIPHDFQPSERIQLSLSERIQLSLSQLWHCSPYPTLHPPDSKLLWKLPVHFTE